MLLNGHWLIRAMGWRFGSILGVRHSRGSYGNGGIIRSALSSIALLD
jgi:hypothetical protein